MSLFSELQLGVQNDSSHRTLAASALVPWESMFQAAVDDSYFPLVGMLCIDVPHVSESNMYPLAVKDAELENPCIIY